MESINNVGPIWRVFDGSEETSVDLDDAWEPLPVDYDSVDAPVAIDSLEAAAEAINNDNGYAVSHLAERATVVASIRSAVGYMRVRGEYTRIYFKYSVVEPLLKAASRLGASAAGKTVEAAIKGVQKWITEFVFNSLGGG